MRVATGFSRKNHSDDAQFSAKPRQTISLSEQAQVTDTIQPKENTEL
jgi:hypothetical protein